MTSSTPRRAEPLMGTVVTIDVVGHDTTRAARAARDAAVERAFGWFRHVEACCSRFDPTSEVSGLTRHVGDAMPVSAVLFEALRFALAVAAETDGAFDPTVGRAMEVRGFDRDHRTGAVVATAIDDDRAATFRDVRLDVSTRTVQLRRSLLLDLGAVAKGLAIDLAVQELRPFLDFAVDAGGDLYLGGHNGRREPWSVGIRHPREPRRQLRTLRLSDAAVCTSGDYERRTPDGRASHILDPRTRRTVAATASATVVADTAMVADALATAAFVLGASAGGAMLERQRVHGLIVSTDLRQTETPGFPAAAPPVPVGLSTETR